MRFLRQSMIGLFLAALTLGMFVYAAHIVGSAVQQRLAEERPTPQPRERVFVVDLVTAEVSTETPVLKTFGRIEARRTLELRSAVAGRIVTLPPDFQDGAAVRAGDVLAQIDPSELQAQVGRLSADLADAEAEVREAARGLSLAQEDEAAARRQANLRQQAFERQLDLAARGVGTAASVEEAELAAAGAQAGVITRRLALNEAEARINRADTQLDRARIALADARRDLSDTTILAPFDGILGATSVVEGGLLAANEKLADLTDLRDLEVAFALSTSQYTRLLDGRGALRPAPVSVHLDNAGGGLRAQGEINRVNAGAGEGQTGRIVFARLENAPGFRPGDFVTVEVTEPVLHDVVRLPTTALNADGHVLALGEDNRLERLDVVLIRRQGNDVLLRGADLAGRDVVRRLTPLLGAGIAVTPARESLEEASAAPMLELSDARRARLIAFVENDETMAPADKSKVLAQLAGQEVPRGVVVRLERRMDS